MNFTGKYRNLIVEELADCTLTKKRRLKVLVIRDTDIRDALQYAALRGITTFMAFFPIMHIV